jgi:hypothetical protein
MKKIILIISFSLLGNLIVAQNITGTVLGTDFSCQKVSNNEYSFTFHTSFNVGFGQTCPPFTNHTITIVGNTLEVKGYYDTTGVWPQSGCDRYDTVIYNNTIPSGISYIEMSTNAIGYNNTPPYSPATLTFENVYSQTFNVTSLSNSNFNNEDDNIVAYPNPTQGNITISNNFDFQKISIIDNLGQIVKNFEKSKSGNYDLKDIQDGLYYIVFYDINTKKIGETKILKSN